MAVIRNVTQETIRLNDFAETRRRTTSRGTKDRVSMSIKADVVTVSFDERTLGAGPANAIKEHIAKRIKGILTTASDATLRKRQSAMMNPGSDWVKKRYSGGRTPAKAPSGSVRLFNDSGRLADGLFVRENITERGWTVNVPANRLDQSTFRTEAEFLAMLEKLRAEVPEIADARRIVKVPEVERAINESVRTMIQVEGDRASALMRQRNAAILRVFGLHTAAKLMETFPARSKPVTIP